MKQDDAMFLRLVREVRIGELLKGGSDKRYEASGVCEKDGYLHIVFDDDPHLLRVRADLSHAEDDPILLDLKGTGSGYEDITYHSSAGRWYCLIEAAETKSGVPMPRVDAFDESFAFIRSYWLDFPLRAGNKGFEGLATLHASGNEYLLGLCEGNKCKGGRAGKTPGEGRIQVFKMDGETWVHTGTLKLPEAVRFGDYSSLDCRDGLLTVISQTSSAMWIGRLLMKPAGEADPKSPEDLFPSSGSGNLLEFADNGRLFLFPRNDNGRIIYGNLEGVTWLGNDRLVVVSDKVKADQPERFARKDQSVHLFRLPAAVLSTDLFFAKG
jgi:hypothetical protein